MTTPLVIGLDLSLTSTGWASNYGHLGTITSTGKADATLGQRLERIRRLTTRITDIAWDLTPHLVLVEGPSYGSSNGHHHDRSGLWWQVVNNLPEPVVEVPPALVKLYATGKGNASKDTVLAAVVRRYPDWTVAGNDQADALTLAAIGARRLGHPIEDSLPEVRVAAVDRVAWPTGLPRPVTDVPTGGLL